MEEGVARPGNQGKHQPCSGWLTLANSEGAFPSSGDGPGRTPVKRASELCKLFSVPLPPSRPHCSTREADQTRRPPLATFICTFRRHRQIKKCTPYCHDPPDRYHNQCLPEQPYLPNSTPGITAKHTINMGTTPAHLSRSDSVRRLLADAFAQPKQQLLRSPLNTQASISHHENSPEARGMMGATTITVVGPSTAPYSQL